MKQTFKKRIIELKILIKIESLKYFDNIIKWQQQIYKDLTETSPNAYRSLSPIDDVDPKDFKEYDEALTWALKNRKGKDIKNIAITGPYGSGKSSVLKTFQKNYAGGEFKFLNISLATFKDDKEEADLGKMGIKEEMLRLIELSILQQIFYHERDDKIPDSRFKKIKRHTWKHLLFGTAYWVLFVLAAIAFKFSGLYFKIIRDLKLTPIQIVYTNYVLGGLALIWIVLLIWRSIRLILKVSISKLTFQDTEIVISDKISNSILNHHLDELLYFFEATEYNVVIIEDLDRFQQTEVFTKLREINLLLNSSKKIKKHIVFVYSVKDDMFKDKDRAKFFDFIIPVIPVINSSNSSQKLLEKKLQNSYNWNDDLIENLALFVDDMRLLHNITNEFHLYHKRLGPLLDQNKLLAMLVYKNIYPEDFSNLSNTKGVLFNALGRKNGYIVKLMEEADIEIAGWKAEIERLEDIRILNVEDIRRLYLIRYIPSLKGFTSFVVNGVDKDVDQMLETRNFDYLKNDQAQYKHDSYNYGNRQSAIPITFATIEETVDKERKYDQVINDINELDNGKIDHIKKAIATREKDKMRFQNFKIKEVLSAGDVKINVKEDVLINGISSTVTNVAKTALINVLLRNGYIDEHYSDYISIFYEGSLTKTDHQFLLNVKSQTASDYTFSLVKIAELIKKINIADFTQPFILNNNLFDFISSQTIYKEQKEAFLNQLKNESTTSISFIKGMMSSSTDVRKFIVNLAKCWPNIWKYIEASELQEEEKEVFFKNILEFSELTDIKKLSEVSNFQSKIISYRNFLTLIPDSRKLREVIDALEVKFSDLDETNLPEDLIQFIYDNNNYAINTRMVKLIAKRFGKLNHAEFDTKNFYCIKNSDCEKMVNYIGNNINEYVANVYLILENNVHEEESSLVELLNFQELNYDEEIILQVETKIGRIDDIEYLSVAEFLVSHSKIVANWENVFSHWLKKEEILSPSILKYLAIKENMLNLSTMEISKEKESEFVGKRKVFIRQLITADTLSDEIYSLLVNALPYSYNNFDTSTLSFERAKILILRRILCLPLENYNSLKEHHADLHLKLIEQNPTKFEKDLANYVLSADDTLALLNSKKLTTAQKSAVIANQGDAFFIADTRLLNSIGKISASDNDFIYSDEILKNILKTTSLSATYKIKVFNSKSTQLSNDEITDFLFTLPDPFCRIADKGKKPPLPNSSDNLHFANILKTRKYISSVDIKGSIIKINTFKS